MNGLIFRTQRDDFTGLNAHLEITGENSRVVGLRVCISEESEKSSRGYIISGDTEIAAYWLQHSLPVVIMLYERESKKIFYESVSTENLEIAGRKWELVIPYEKEYNGENAAQEIKNLTCTSPYLARLALDKALIELINQGQEIFLELDEWINQPSSRGNLRICITGHDSEQVYQWPFDINPDVPQVLRLPELFPWAEISIDEDFYSAKNFHDFDSNLLAPYIIESGEIARFRFKLELNSLGKSFLIAEPYICRGIFPTMNQQNISYGSEYESGLKFQLYRKI